MIIKPRVRGFICTTSHPHGCRKNVEEAANYVGSQPSISGPSNALVVGCSTGYGLASRLVATLGCNANTIGISLDREPTENSTATAGWYNNEAHDEMARRSGLDATTLNRDAFAHETRRDVIDLLRRNNRKLDLIVYSVASPVRTHPDSDERYRSVIKPLGSTFKSQTLVPDVMQKSAELREIELEPATPMETAATVKVMGGEDWELWINQLYDAGVISKSCITVAFTYLGNELTQPIYRGGTLGKAKEDLDRACEDINSRYETEGIRAFVAALKAVVTQASTAIPIVPLYFSILFKVMKSVGTHEDSIQHIYRLFREQLYTDKERRLDEEGRLRLDNFELAEEVQTEVKKRWGEISSENLREFADMSAFTTDFLKLFGFERDDIDYEVEQDPMTCLSPE